MADFASLILSGGVLNATQLETELETKLPCRITSFSGAPASPTSSLTYTSLYSNTVSIASDDVVFFISQMTLKNTGANNRTFIDNNINSVAQSPIYVHLAGVADIEHSATVFNYATGLSGTITFDVKWAVSAGTTTCDSIRVWVVQFKVRT